jgi:hypothetical protein
LIEDSHSKGWRSKAKDAFRGDKDSYRDTILAGIFLLLMIGALWQANIFSIALPIALAVAALVFLLLLAIKVSPGKVAGLQIISTIFIVIAQGALTGDMIVLMFLSVWELSVIAGMVGGNESRPALGIIMIFMALLVFSFTATGIMGQAVFGYWWPQIASAGEAIAAPIGPMIDQMQTGMGGVYMIITDPMAYIRQMQEGPKVNNVVVKEGGTTKSIDVSKFDLHTAASGQIDPRAEALSGTIEVQNQGEFDAERIDLEIWATWQDPKSVVISGSTPSEETGILDYGYFKCSNPYDFSKSSPLSGTGALGKCVWDSKTTYPGEIRVVNFVFTDSLTNSASWITSGTSQTPSVDLSSCIVKEPDTGEITCKPSTDCCSDPKSVYFYGSQAIKINANVTYDYNVNVSMAVDVIAPDAYDTLLQAKKITLQEVTSQYTGGPVKASLWSQSQPIRAEETSQFVASITNAGVGVLKKIMYYDISIPSSFVSGSPTIVSQTFRSSGNKGCAVIAPTTVVSNWVIHCENDLSMKAGESRMVAFYIEPKQISVDRISRLIIGLANYEYIKTTSKSVSIANNPIY